MREVEMREIRGENPVTESDMRKSERMMMEGK